jgi:hypothetical protein
MAFITLGTATQLQIKVPSPGSTDWATTMQTDTFLKIAQHAHTGAGDGSTLGAAALAADSVTGAKIRLDNDEYLRARNAANTANVNLLKLDTGDDLYVDAQISKLLLKNNTFLTGRNQADSANIDILKIDGGDDLSIDPDISKLVMKNNVAIQSDNSGGTPTDVIKLDGSDELVINPDINKLVMKNNTWIQSDNSGGTPSSVLKLNGSDKIEVGANIVATSVETSNTSLIQPLTAAVTLNDNQSATSASVVTLTSGQACTITYKITRNSVVQHGTLKFLDSDTTPIESFIGTDVGITFTVNSGDLEYASTSTGNSATMDFVVIKE